MLHDDVTVLRHAGAQCSVSAAQGTGAGYSCALAQYQAIGKQWTGYGDQYSKSCFSSCSLSVYVEYMFILHYIDQVKLSAKPKIMVMTGTNWGYASTVLFLPSTTQKSLNSMLKERNIRKPDVNLTYFCYTTNRASCDDLNLSSTVCLCLYIMYACRQCSKQSASY